MSRYSSSGAHGFSCKKISADLYRIAWSVDYYYSGDRVRYPRRITRHTDEKGAIRFCKKHRLTSPPDAK